MAVFRSVAGEVASEFTAAGVPVLAIKGFALAHGVYRRDGERAMGDWIGGGRERDAVSA